MKISAVIATLNRPDDLRKAVASVAAQTLAPAELVIVDQSVDGRTREVVEAARSALEARGTALAYVRQEERSLVKARNRGIDAARHAVIGFLDDDVVLHPDYFERVAAFLTAHPEVGGVSGNTLLDGSKLKGAKWAARKAIMRLFLIDAFDGRMTASGFGHPIVDREIERVRYVEMLPGCNMTFRREAMGGERFDEWFTGYSYREDAEYAYRVSRRARLAMIPDAKLRHYYSTGNRLDPAALKRMSVRNYAYVARKFRKGPLARALFVYSLLGLTLIDLLELASSRNRQKLDNLKAGLASMREAVAGGKG